MIIKDLFAFALDAVILGGGFWLLWRMGERAILRYDWAGFLGWYVGILMGILAGVALGN